MERWLEVAEVGESSRVEELHICMQQVKVQVQAQMCRCAGVHLFRCAKVGAEVRGGG